MKKLFAVILSVLFLGATSGVVFAQTSSATPKAKTKTSKKMHKSKKKTKKAVKTSTTPAAK